MNLDDIPDERLVAELNRREEVRKLHRQVQQNNIRYGLTDGLIALVTPIHSRTSCSDNDLGNGFGSADYGPRCARCALLQIVKDRDAGSDFELSFDVTFHKRT